MNRLISILRVFVFFSLAAIMVGCGGIPATIPISPPTNPPPTGPTVNNGAAQRIYVVQQPLNVAGGTVGVNGTILEFAATSSGSVMPTSTITPGTSVEQLATDAVGNIYYAGTNIVEYASGASGTPTALRQITAGSNARICCVDGLAVAPDGTVVLGQDNGEVDIWKSTASGNVAPDRYILGASETGGGMSPVEVANQVAVDSLGTVYVGAANAPGVAEVVVFGPGATGNAAPDRTIGSDGVAGGVAVDSSGNVYTTTETCTFSGTTGSCSGIISVYGASSSSVASPTRVISGSLTQLGSVWGIKVDAVGNIFVISTDFEGSNPTVLKFSASATGNVAPSSSFTSTTWTSPGFNPSIALY